MPSAGPSPDAAGNVLRCPCGHTLAERTAGVYSFSHRGRRMVFRGAVLSARCDRCGRETDYADPPASCPGPLQLVPTLDGSPDGPG